MVDHRPRRPARIDDSLPQQQLGHPVPGAHQIPAGVLPGPYQVPSVLLGHRGDPHRRQLPDVQQPGPQPGRCSRATSPTRASSHGRRLAGPTTATSPGCSSPSPSAGTSRSRPARAETATGTSPSASTRPTCPPSTSTPPSGTATSAGSRRSASPAPPAHRYRASRPTSAHAALVVVLRSDDHVGIGESQLPNVHDDLRDPRG